MLSEGLIEKILQRVAPTKEERTLIAQKRMTELNHRLERQLEAQRMTPEVLNKACTL